MLSIYHNPRCSKSRQALALLEAQGLKPKIIDYLKNPPNTQELDSILKKLKLEPQEILRKKEKIYTELDLANQDLNRSALIKIMVTHPILMERPIVVNGEKAALGRPPEEILKIL